MAKQPWRFQGDIAHSETDPTVTVFMGETETDDDGKVSVRQDTRDPLTMKLSELTSAMHLADPAKMQGVADKRKVDRIKAKADFDAAVMAANVQRRLGSQTGGDA